MEDPEEASGEESELPVSRLCSDADGGSAGT